jgi:Animal haem peroxidase
MDTKSPTFSPTFQPSLVERVLVGSFKIVNKFIPWHKLPSFLGVFNLDALRIELRQNNLQDGYASGTAQGNAADVPLTNDRFKDSRNSDGKFNSTVLPLMGCAGQRFGRNFPRQYTSKPTEAEMMTPNPRMISEIFMTRKEFIPATTLNLLAAAWIQFQTHDWFVHENVAITSPCFRSMTNNRRMRKSTMCLYQKETNGHMVI